MNRNKTQRGVALITVFGVSLIVVLLAALISQLVAQYYQLQRQQMQRTLHHYLASSGINHAVMELFRRAPWLTFSDPNDSRTTWVPTGTAGRSYTISIDGVNVLVEIHHNPVTSTADQYEIKATAPVPLP